jgi:hypothetical protein
VIVFSFIFSMEKEKRKSGQFYFVMRGEQAVAELKRCPDEYLRDFGGLRMTVLAGRK